MPPESSARVESSPLVPPVRLLRTLKSGQAVPVTLRFVGPVPTSTAKPAIADGHSRTEAAPDTSRGKILYGIEYDDASLGRHDGVFEGQQLFSVDQPGSGSFLTSPKDLKGGWTFVEALQDRYGVSFPAASDDHDNSFSAGNAASRAMMVQGEKDTRSSGSRQAEIVLGGSAGAIMVAAPGMDAVEKRLSQLRRLKTIGLDGYYICELGGSATEKRFLRESLSGLEELDLSHNLLCSFSDIAEIVHCAPNLPKLRLNNMRLVKPDPDLSHDGASMPGWTQSFINIRELELCDCLLDAALIPRVGVLFPNLQRLDLVDNRRITVWQSIPETGTQRSFQHLAHLNLAGCGISSWADLMQGVASLPKLDTLDISANPIDSIPPRPTSHPILRVSSLIMANAHITSWRDIDALASWIGSTMSSLRFTSTSTASPPASGGSPAQVSAESESRSVKPAGDNAFTRQSWRITGNADLDRPFLIAKLPSLTVLNSSAITAAERKDAEIRYVRRVTEIIPATDGEVEHGGHAREGASDWGRYDELRRLHGFSLTGDTTAAPPTVSSQASAPLKAKMLHLSVLRNGAPVGTTTILPSASISLLRKKLVKLVPPAVGDGDMRLWTVRTLDSRQEKAAEVEAGENVGWWFSDGDDVWVDQ